MDKFAQIVSAAHDGAFGIGAREQPSLGAVRAGTYKKGRVDLYGLKIAIETPQGQRRTGKADGEPWSVICQAHYGYITGTKGADGDAIDVFIGSWPETEAVYVVNQNKQDGSFDEHKILLCFPSKDAAEAAYMNSYERGWKGLGSIVCCTVEQLKWWIKNGNTSLPLSSKSLPYDGNAEMTDTVWDSEAQPVGTDLAGLVYALRRDDNDGLLLDAVTVSDVLEDADSEMALDALVIPLNRLERKMNQVNVIMAGVSDTVKPIAMQITPPFKQRGTTNVAVIFELSDGQTITVFFHNPDTTPNKLTPDDEMVSWKWLLNKKDVTILVAPEKGRELNPREVARRVMRLATKNSARFAAANANKSERMASIESMKQAVEAKETELTTLKAVVVELAAKAEVKRRTKAPDPSGVVPDTVKSAITFHVKRLQDIASSLDNVVRVRGNGQNLVLALRDNQTKIDESLAKIEEIRALAKKNNADVESVIADLGGIPDFAKYGSTGNAQADRSIAVKEQLGNLGWGYSKSSTIVTVTIDGSEYAVKSDQSSGTGIVWADTDSDLKWPDDMSSLTAYDMALKIDREFRKSIADAKNALGAENAGNSELLDAGFVLVGGNEYVKSIKADDKTLRFNIRAGSAGFRATLAVLFSGGITGGSIALGVFKTAAEAIAAVEKEIKARTSDSKFDPTTPEGYAQAQADGKLEAYQDQLDSFFQERLIAIRNGLRDLGWGGERFKDLSKFGYTLKTNLKQVGGGANIVGINFEIIGVDGFFMSDTLVNTPEEMAKKIDMGLAADKPEESGHIFNKVLSVVLNWSEGSNDSEKPFASIAELDKWFKKTFKKKEMDAIVKDGGYRKNRLTIVLENKKGEKLTIEPRIDVSKSEGDFDPTTQGLASYLREIGYDGVSPRRIAGGAESLVEIPDEAGASVAGQGSDSGDSAVTIIIGHKDSYTVGKKRYENGPNGFYSTGRGSQPLTSAVFKADGGSVLIDDYDLFAEAGLVTITSVGSENVYFEKGGVPYFTKLLNTDEYEDKVGQQVDLSSVKDPSDVPLKQGPLPWDGAAKSEEGRWYGTTIKLTAIDRDDARLGLVREGEATLIEVFNGGKVLSVLYPNMPSSVRLSITDQYIVEVIKLIDNETESGDGDLVSIAVEAARSGAGGITRLKTGKYFTFNVDGEDVILTDELRAKVEAALGSKLVEKVFPGYELEIALVPQSKDGGDLPYDPSDMDAAVQYAKETERLFRSGDIVAAWEHYQKDPNGGASRSFTLTMERWMTQMYAKLGILDPREIKYLIDEVDSILKSTDWKSNGDSSWINNGWKAEVKGTEVVVSEYVGANYIQRGSVELKGDAGKIVKSIENLIATGSVDVSANEKEEMEEQAKYSKFNRAMLKMPTAVQLSMNRLNQPILVTYRDQEGWSNGHILALHKPKILTDAIAKYHADETNLRRLGEEAVARVIPRDASVKVEPIAAYDSSAVDMTSLASAANRSMSGAKSKKDVNVIKTKGVVLANEEKGIATLVDTGYFAYFDKMFKKPDYFLAPDGNGAILVKKSGEIVGVMMPIKGDMAKTLKRAAKAAGIEAAPAATPAEAFRHEGFNIYPINTPSGNSWAVQSIDNLAKEQAGERQIGGDGIFNTKEKAMEEASRQATQMAKDEADAAANAIDEQAALAAEEANAAEYADIGEVYGETAMQRGRRVASLSTQIRDTDGEVLTTKKFIEKRVAAGWTPIAEEEDRYKPLTGRQINRMSNAEQAAYAKKVKEGGTVTAYYLEKGDTTSKLTKIGYDYAVYLVGKGGSTQGDSAMSEATAFLNDVIAGKVNYMDDALGARLEDLHAQFQNDPDFMGLFEKAATAYSDAVVAAAKAAM